MSRNHPSTHRAVLGWREWVALPDCGVSRIKAKIDTGARTSALHAFRLEEFVEGDTLWARFEVHPDQRSSRNALTVIAPIVEHRRIRSSNGTVQSRPVIETTLEVLGQRFTIDLTLTNRDEMGFRMLIGRAALRRRFLVDPSRSYYGGGR
ncbi:MAG: RimK/LysX family protein [Acidimicrobiales bacterium]